MLPHTRTSIRSIALLSLLAGGCRDSSTPLDTDEANLDAVKFWEVTASTRWNTRAALLLVQRPPASNGQAAASRMLTYLSIAQYRAVLAAEAGKQGSVHPSVPAAVGGASVAVLSSFFPLDAASIEAQLQGDLTSPGWPGSKNEDPAAGEAIGRAVGAAVLASAATDNYLVASPGTPPVGPGYWVSSASPIVRSLYGVRPFFMTASDQLRSPPPPAFGSPEFVDALTEVRTISDTRTPEQLAIAQFWNTSTAPFTAGTLNLLTDDLILNYKRTEREAARILAYANAAAFDAQIACFDTKFAYWFIRPSQADPAITLPIGLPNHPSYPSAHSCITSALLSVVADAFPAERTRLMSIVEEAGRSRVYGGIHYQFDIDAGQEIGKGAAALALAGKLE